MARDVEKRIEQLIVHSERLSEWIYEHVDGLDIPSNRRGRFAGACFSIALQHRTAIVLLVRNHTYPAAFALIRVIYDTYIRGIWLFKCASDAELERYKHGRLRKTLDQMIRDIERVEGFDVGVLSDIRSRSWSTMNGFVHSGYEQIARHQTEGTIEPNYDGDEIVEAINFATAIALLSAVAMADLANTPQLAADVLEKIKHFSQLDIAA